MDGWSAYDRLLESAKDYALKRDCHWGCLDDDSHWGCLDDDCIRDVLDSVWV